MGVWAYGHMGVWDMGWDMGLGWAYGIGMSGLGMGWGFRGWDIGLKLPFKTSFEALKFFETPKLQKNDKNVNISSSSDRKRMDDGSLESPQ